MPQGPAPSDAGIHGDGKFFIMPFTQVMAVGPMQRSSNIFVQPQMSWSPASKENVAAVQRQIQVSALA